MKYSGTAIFLSYLLCAAAQTPHDDLAVTGCSDSDSTEMYGLDGEIEEYVDFINKKAVSGLPPFVDPYSIADLYQRALVELQGCRQNLNVSRRAYKNPPLELDPPVSTIYTRDDVALGVENTLTCHVTGFFPAPVKVWWTRNTQRVNAGVGISVPYPNKDYTFNQFSHLSFTPEEGDIYTCTVEHRALTEPLTRMWEVDVSQPSVGPAVFCGVGLTLGLLGVAAGTFFLIKGNECN